MDEQKKPEITEVAIVDEHSIRDKIYVVRGVKVMLDFELAEIYGYTTAGFISKSKETKNVSMRTFAFSLQGVKLNNYRYHKM